MHEIGLLYSAAKIATQCAEENGMDAVNVITLELGELAGVVPEVFTEYFDYVKMQFDKLGNSRLVLKTVPGEALCADCGAMYNVMKHKGICPSCSGGDKTVISGRDVRIISIA